MVRLQQYDKSLTDAEETSEIRYVPSNTNLAHTCRITSTDLTRLQRTVGTWSRLSCLIRLLSSESLGYKDKEKRDKNEVDEGGGKHPADHCCSDGVLGSRSGPSGYGKGQHAEEERH